MNTVTNRMTGETVTISDIEHLDEKTAMSIAEESTEIKGHNIYFVDFEGYFGYSCLVFCNGHHIHYANDYELHHRGRTREELKAFYLEALNHKLYTEEELSEPIKNYNDYESKRYFLQNYYGMRQDYISAFRICSSEKEEKAFEKSVQGMFYNPVCYAFYKDKDFVQHCVKLHIALTAAKQKTLDNFDYWKDAFVTEMFNHEYAINWQADFDTLQAFGNPEWRRGDKNTLEAWFKDCGFNALQKRAYKAAREEYYKRYNEKGDI